MVEPFLTLPKAIRSEALAFAADASGRPADILEKDVWVVLALKALFDAPFGDHLCFKGGTSLSKAYGVIERFSEDVDVTCDIREILGDELGQATADPIPTTRSQAHKWSKAVKQRLPEWVEQIALPEIQTRVNDERVPAEVRAEADRLILAYEQVTSTANDYVVPHILVEFGARSTGEPLESRPVVCDAAGHLTGLTFPTASPRVMAAERTFWEKATAAHVYCLQGRLRAARHARHWYDLVRLDDAGLAAAALADRDLGRTVADYKNLLFAEKNAAGEWIDYRTATEGDLHLVPTAGPRIDLEGDYRRMIDAGLLEVAAPSFDEVMNRCAEIEIRANAK